MIRKLHNTLSLTKKITYEESLLTKTASIDAKLALKQYFIAHKEELWKSFVNALVDMLPLDTDMHCSPIHTCTFDITGSSVNEKLVYVGNNTISEVEFAINLNLTVNKS